MQQEVKVLEIVKKSLLDENEKLMKELKDRDDALDSATQTLDKYKKKFGEV